jgi:hypothetical protein
VQPRDPCVADIFKSVRRPWPSRMWRQPPRDGKRCDQCDTCLRVVARLQRDGSSCCRDVTRSVCRSGVVPLGQGQHPILAFETLFGCRTGRSPRVADNDRSPVGASARLPHMALGRSSSR